MQYDTTARLDHRCRIIQKTCRHAAMYDVCMDTDAIIEICGNHGTLELNALFLRALYIQRKRQSLTMQPKNILQDEKPFDHASNRLSPYTLSICYI